jgi:hypothetical protein
MMEAGNPAMKGAGTMKTAIRLSPRECDTIERAATIIEEYAKQYFNLEKSGIEYEAIPEAARQYLLVTPKAMRSLADANREASIR